MKGEGEDEVSEEDEVFVLNLFSRLELVLFLVNTGSRRSGGVFVSFGALFSVPAIRHPF